MTMPTTLPMHVASAGCRSGKSARRTAVNASDTGMSASRTAAADFHRLTSAPPPGANQPAKPPTTLTVRSPSVWRSIASRMRRRSSDVEPAVEVLAGVERQHDDGVVLDAGTGSKRSARRKPGRRRQRDEDLAVQREEAVDLVGLARAPS